MKSTIDMMAQHMMQVQYAYDIHTDLMWVQVTCNTLVATEYTATKKGLAQATRNCVKKLVEALK